ncbi:MAG TPA: decaprenyl-phosphate phosphoribosyltransferase [Acidimicrobiales bacterium]|nr:decaprenyl-phosphate phosphoribosyltransferase [Acidimicrobiales bacterium]
MTARDAAVVGTDPTVAGRPHGGAVGPLLRAVRPRQWTKNVLVLLAPAAAGVLGRPAALLHVLGAFGVFCAAAAGTYLVNDTVDAAADRQHPEKRHRPVASGELPSALAATCGASLLVVAVAGAWLLAGWSLTAVVGAYVAVTIAYTVRLKREPVIEMAAVASCFVLRATAGGAAVHVPLSNWFLVVTCFGALFVVVGKRSAERARLGPTGSGHRAVLASYSPSFLRSTLTMSAAVTLTAYFLWAFDGSGLSARAGGRVVWVQLTVVPVIVAVLHVLHLLDAGRGGTPEDLALKDRLLQVLGATWVALFAVGLYG